jgi:hypothetical protein
VLAAACAAIVFLPPEGLVGRPLHDFVTILLGPTTFALPIGLAFVGVIMTLQRVKPNILLPRKRLVGVALVSLGVVAAEHLLGGTSLLGLWLTSALVANVGVVVTGSVCVALTAVGTFLAFDLPLPRRRRAAAS